VLSNEQIFNLDFSKINKEKFAAILVLMTIEQRNYFRNILWQGFMRFASILKISIGRR